MLIDIAPNIERPGVVCGFGLSFAPGAAAPTIGTGVLFAQGQMYRPNVAPVLPSPPAGMSWLCFNQSAGFYWRATPTVQTAGDAGPIGWVVKSGGVVVAASRQQITVPDSSPQTSIIPLAPVQPADSSSPGAIGSTYAPDNWLTNADFEQGLTGWTASPGVVTSLDSYTGVGAASIPAGGQISQQSAWSVRPGDTMTAEAYVKAAGATANVQITVRYYNAAGAQVGSDLTDSQAPVSSYTKIYISALVPSGASAAMVIISAASGSGSWTVDTTILFRAVSISTGLTYTDDGGIGLGSTAPSNAVLNPNFDDGLGAWDVSNAAGAASDAADAMVAGGNCLRMPGSGEYIVSEPFAVTPGQIITFSAWVKAQGCNSSVSVELVTIGGSNTLQSYIANPTFPTGGTAQGGAYVAPGGASSWTQIGGQTTIAGGIRRCYVIVHSWGGTSIGAWLIGNVSAVLEKKYGPGLVLLSNGAVQVTPGSGLSFDGSNNLTVKLANGLAIGTGGVIQVKCDSTKGLMFDGSGNLVVNTDSNDFQFVSGYLAMKRIDLKKAANFDTTAFTLTSGSGTFSINQLSATTIVLGWYSVGGSTGMPGQMIVYGAGGVPVGWLGQNGIYYGGWLRQFYGGGSDPSTACFVVDAYGNASISNATFTLQRYETGGATYIVSINSAYDAGFGTSYHTFTGLQVLRANTVHRAVLINRGVVCFGPTGAVLAVCASGNSDSQGGDSTPFWGMSYVANQYGQIVAGLGGNGTSNSGFVNVLNSSGTETIHLYGDTGIVKASGFQTGTQAGLTGNYPAGTNFKVAGGLVVGTY